MRLPLIWPPGKTDNWKKWGAWVQCNDVSGKKDAVQRDSINTESSFYCISERHWYLDGNNFISATARHSKYNCLLLAQLCKPGNWWKVTQTQLWMVLVAAPVRSWICYRLLCAVEHINKAPYSHTIQTDRKSPAIKTHRRTNMFGPDCARGHQFLAATINMLNTSLLNGCDTVSWHND